MRDLLLEIGLEEVPAKFMPPALAELKQLADLSSTTSDGEKVYLRR